jgi:hypothetical protein
MATPVSGEQVLNPSTGEVFRGAEPVVVPNASLPADFAAQFPTPLDPTEILDLCEELTLWKYIPEKITGLKTELWREMTSLAFTSGSNYIAFGDYLCPEEYAHNGENKTLDLKNIGAKKSLGISDIKHSMAVIAGGAGIEALLGGHASGQGLPGAFDGATFARESIASLKAKEVRLGMTLVMNGWDRLLAVGNATTRPLEFDGIENLVTVANGAHRNCTGTSSASGSIDAEYFDRFLYEGCARPTVIMGHPAAIQELMASYFALGFQVAVVPGGEMSRIVPGVNFGGFLNTAIGRLAVVADTNFTRTAIGQDADGFDMFRSNIYALKMAHNGEPFIYKSTQIPLSMIDLTPGCTSIAFEIWAKTALVIKAMCTQGFYTANSTGCIVTTCTRIG